MEWVIIHNCPIFGFYTVRVSDGTNTVEDKGNMRELCERVPMTPIIRIRNLEKTLKQKNEVNHGN